MHTTRRLAALGVALITMGCGPTTINVTTTGEGSGGETNDVPPGEATSLGGSETGPVDTSTTTGDSTTGGESSSASTGSGSTDSSSSGEPLPVCLVDEETWECWCDGAQADPSLCGCFDDPVGWCTCPEGAVHEPCPRPCEPQVVEVDELTERCMCGDEPVDPVECGCVAVEGGCMCDGLDTPIDRFSCGWPCGPSGPDPCVCGNLPAPSSWCD